MKTSQFGLLIVALLGATLPGCSNDKKETTQEAPLTRTDSVEVTMTAKVVALDQATRVMTLRDEQGHQYTFVVSDRVHRLHEVRVGDNVRIRYESTLVAELRPPTPEEAADPISVTFGQSRTPEGNTPVAARAQVIRMVTTVEELDLAHMKVTLRGPMGDTAVVRGKHIDNMRQLNVGDTIVITTTRTVAVALEKIAPR